MPTKATKIRLLTADDCQRCAHPQSWHRHDDADNHAPDDPACPFRCIGYDCFAPGPPPAENPCGCPDFVALDEKE
jgi:hypothetical protein